MSTLLDLHNQARDILESFTQGSTDHAIPVDLKADKPLPGDGMRNWLTCVDVSMADIQRLLQTIDPTVVREDEWDLEWGSYTEGD